MGLAASPQMQVGLGRRVGGWRGGCVRSMAEAWRMLICIRCFEFVPAALSGWLDCLITAPVPPLYCPGASVLPPVTAVGVL